MARKRSSQPEEGQFSLDDFINQEPASKDNVPGMIDLTQKTEQVERKPADSKPLRTFTIPSRESTLEKQSTPSTSSDIYHNLGKMYPNPPIPMNNSGMVLHRATLFDLTGIDTLLDWVSDGDAALVEMARYGLGPPSSIYRNGHGRPNRSNYGNESDAPAPRMCWYQRP